MDGATFLQLYLPLRQTIKDVCRVMMSDPDEAEDVTQDVYLKLWEQRAQLSRVNSPKAYVITLARNRCLDKLRAPAYKLREDAEFPEQLGATQSSSQTTPLHQLIAKEQAQKLAKWVSQLPMRQQEIFKLRHYEMLNNQEIADRLEINEVTVRSIVSRLRKEARTLFEEN